MGMKEIKHTVVTLKRKSHGHVGINTEPRVGFTHAKIFHVGRSAIQVTSLTNLCLCVPHPFTCIKMKAVKRCRRKGS